MSLEIRALGLGIRILRETVNLTQEEAVMAARTTYPEMSFTVSTLSNWERGKLGNLASIWALVRALGFSGEDLLAAVERARSRLDKEPKDLEPMSLDEWAKHYEAKLANNEEARGALERLKKLVGEETKARSVGD